MIEKFEIDKSELIIAYDYFGGQKKISVVKEIKDILKLEFEKRKDFVMAYQKK